MIELRRNTATSSTIASHLDRCDQDFVPPLSSRVVIVAYAAKISERAVRFEAWSDDALVGLVAAYDNDEEHGAVYVSSVSVVQEFQGRGIASRLMDECIEHARQRRFNYVRLQVDTGNTAAIRLYEGKGLTITGRNERRVDMAMEFRGP